MVTLANSITLARIAGIPFFILALLYWSRSSATIIFAILAISDMFDGWIARRRNEKSHAGAVLDPLADKLLVGAALIFLIGQGVEHWMAFVIIAREFAVTGARVLSDKIVSASWMGKAKTVSQVIAILFVLTELPFAYHLLVFSVILTVISGLDYIIKAAREVEL